MVLFPRIVMPTIRPTPTQGLTVAHRIIRSLTDCVIPTKDVTARIEEPVHLLVRDLLMASLLELIQDCTTQRLLVAHIAVLQIPI